MTWVQSIVIWDVFRHVLELLSRKVCQISCRPAPYHASASVWHGKWWVEDAASPCVCVRDRVIRWEESVTTMRVRLVVLLMGMVMVAARVEGRERTKRCAATQCRDCIQSPGCVWCIMPKDEGMSNCQHGASINLTSFCDPTYLQNPQNEFVLVRDDDLTMRERNHKGKSNEEIIQLKPQSFKLRLRRGEAQNITITYRRANAYPVDLYYLMDLSNSMKDDKENLVAVSDVLAQTLYNLTDQYMIGFGSFVDKVMMPYADTVQQKTPCRGCAPTYSFRNDMRLNNNPEEFKKGVKAARISWNQDSPEGGFDALMQAMVCKNKIGWRDVARRILVFSTDASFHQAGDGRLAGVVAPNDGQCHLNEEGEYTDYDKYDYPSIGQITKVSKESGINVIFAVLSNPKLYEDLSRQSDTFSYGLLNEGSSNVVDLIKEQYESISSELSLDDNSTEDVTIAYSSACKGSEITKTNKCGNIKENDEITFTLEVTANRCPADGKGSIVEVKTLEDKVILDIEFLCSCDCPPDTDRSKCKNHGVKVCGVCECDVDYYGDECQCGGDGNSGGISSENEALDKRCFASEEDTRPCSGWGNCYCGTCRCKDEHVTGQFCECNERRCSLGTDQVCSGHGSCECDTCKCDSGYTGSHCQCRDDSACKEPGSDKVCSGHGKCECGKCRCDSQGNDTYTGRFCEDCLRCGTGKCSQFRDCVQCIHFGNGPRQHDCNTCEKSEAVENLDEQVYKGARLCTVEDEDGCYVNFTYRYIERESRDEVFVQAERQCPEPPPILPIVFAVIGTIVAVGIITLLIWKVLTHIHDQREYAKFEKESQNAKFNAEENPLYKSAATTVQNPVFSAQQQAK